MFWSIPLLLALPLTWRWPRLSGALGIALGLIASVRFITWWSADHGRHTGWQLAVTVL